MSHIFDELFCSIVAVVLHLLRPPGTSRKGDIFLARITAAPCRSGSTKTGKKITSRLRELDSFSRGSQQAISTQPTSHYIAEPRIRNRLTFSQACLAWLSFLCQSFPLAKHLRTSTKALACLCLVPMDTKCHNDSRIHSTKG